MELFEFFQKQEKLLQEAPPERVWKRLEAKLEHRRKRKQRRSIRFLQTGAVLVLLLLLLLAAVVVWYFAHREGL